MERGEEEYAFGAKMLEHLGVQAVGTNGFRVCCAFDVVCGVVDREQLTCWGVRELLELY